MSLCIAPCPHLPNELAQLVSRAECGKSGLLLKSGALSKLNKQLVQQTSDKQQNGKPISFSSLFIKKPNKTKARATESLLPTLENSYLNKNNVSPYAIIKWLSINT